MANRHKRKQTIDKNLIDMNRKELKDTFQNVTDSMRMDGKVKSYDKETGKGTLIAQDGKIYNFTYKRNYMSIETVVSFIGGTTRAYNIRKENYPFLKRLR